MTNALLFEGRDLEEVLSEAQLCFGADVEIVAANRVRKGGILGFFAKEWFEVWAHGADPISTTPALALLDREAEQGLDQPDSFQSMVANALAEQGPADEAEAAMERFFGHVDPPSGGASQPSRVRHSPGIDALPAATTDPGPGPSGAVALATRPETVTHVRAANGLEVRSDPAPATLVTPATVALEDPPRGSSIFDQPRTQRTDVLWAMLDRIEGVATAKDLPAQGVVVFIGDATLALPAIQQLGARLGAWSSEIAVVTKRRLADVPTWLSVDDLDDLAARAPRWRRRAGCVPVLIDESIEKPDLERVTAVIDALEPAQIRLVTEAWRLPEHVGRVAIRLGGVDALELTEVSDSLDPLAMLDLDIPIGSVEGRPSSPALLAAVWLDKRRRG